MRFRFEISLSFGDDDQEDRYEDGVGTQQQTGSITGFNYTRPEDM